MQREAEDDRDRQPDEPVSDEVGVERRVRIAGAAQRARRRGLQPVGELEDRGHVHERHGHDQHARVVGEQRRQLRARTRRSRPRSPA